MPLNALLTGYQTWLFDTQPVRADLACAEGYADRLGDFTAAGFEARERAVDDWLVRFEAVGSDQLGTEDAVERDLVVSVLRGEQVAGELPTWRLDSGSYLQPVFASLLGTFLHRLRPEPEFVESAPPGGARCPRCWPLAGRTSTPSSPPRCWSAAHWVRPAPGGTS